MMRLKPFSKNSVKPALPFSLILITIFIFACSSEIPPTYKKEEIPNFIKKICKEEYSLNVTTRVVGNTLWVYAPITRIIDKDYAVTKDKFFDDDMNDKLRKIMTSIGRVLISSDRAPEFYCLIISDIEERGLDYTLIGNVIDIKKSYAGFIPWAETNRRYVRKLENAPLALGDTEGKHIKPYDINLPEFIASQIAQRIEDRFREDDLKYQHQVNIVEARFTPTTLVINADIKKQDMRIITSQNDYLTKEVLKIIASVTRAYDFSNFSSVEINDSQNGKSTIINRTTVEAIKE
ncbi:MAG: hypothetical protein Q8N14_02345 [Candidatus Omnitrophota bacterium]|nr:hypothetical protein [Candidatus Omnitrophota bacterium]